MPLASPLTPSREFSPTEERILVAALGLIGRRGVRRLGMQEIAEAAGVSRGTLYRYFPSKDQRPDRRRRLRRARFSRGSTRCWPPRRTPAGTHRRLHGLRLRLHPVAPGPSRSSSPNRGSSWATCSTTCPPCAAELVYRLGDALDTVPAVASGALDREQLADVIVRLFASSWIIPESDDASLVQSVNRILQIESEEPMEH